VALDIGRVPKYPPLLSLSLSLPLLLLLLLLLQWSQARPPWPARYLRLPRLLAALSALRRIMSPNSHPAITATPPSKRKLIVLKSQNTVTRNYTRYLTANIFFPVPTRTIIA
jgi:hypothetical protein